MATSKDTTHNKTSAAAPQDSPTPPAQHIWLAGLGAMAKAQEQGSKAIETLLSDGLAFQRKSQAEAQQRLHEATERLSHLATDFGQQATGRVDKLEHMFEDRVAKALHRLGMPTLLDIQMLSDRVAQLESQLAAALKTPAPVPSARKTPSPTAAKTTAKTTAKTAAKSAPQTAPKPAVKTAPKTPVKNTRSKSA